MLSGGIESPSNDLEKLYLYEYLSISTVKEFTIGITRLPAYRTNAVYSSVIMPFWLLLTLAAFPTALLWQRDRRTVKPGCCLTCGYDLRASKKICPECGTPIAPVAR